jgi:hypothetical protein
MHTPEEAIEELEFVTKQLGSKVGMFGSGIADTAAAKGADPDLAKFAAHFDQLGLDSDYDYDPVWRKCQELRMRRPSIPAAAASACATRRQLHLQPHRPFRRRRATVANPCSSVA